MRAGAGKVKAKAPDRLPIRAGLGRSALGCGPDGRMKRDMQSVVSASIFAGV